MKSIEKWRSNDEERASLRMALYEAKKKVPRKTYDQLGKEFGISSSDATRLISEYCKIFSLREPPVVILPGEPYNGKNKLPIGTRIEFNGQTGVLIEEFYHYFKVLLDETKDFAHVSRIDLSLS